MVYSDVICLDIGCINLSFTLDGKRFMFMADRYEMLAYDT